MFSGLLVGRASAHIFRCRAQDASWRTKNSRLPSQAVPPHASHLLVPSPRSCSYAEAVATAVPDRNVPSPPPHQSLSLYSAPSERIWKRAPRLILPCSAGSCGLVVCGLPGLRFEAVSSGGKRIRLRRKSSTIRWSKTDRFWKARRAVSASPPWRTVFRLTLPAGLC